MNLLRLTLPRFYLISQFAQYVGEWTVRMDRPILILLSLLSKKSLNVLLADDDADDRELFTMAIEEIAPNIKVTTSRNGLELMNTLNDESVPLPDILFLDLNMPFKNGQECLHEIRKNKRLKSLPVIIYSTSSDREYVDQTYNNGANYYLTKPDSFLDLKLIASKLFALDWGAQAQPQKDKFVLNPKHFK